MAIRTIGSLAIVLAGCSSIEPRADHLTLSQRIRTAQDCFPEPVVSVGRPTFSQHLSGIHVNVPMRIRVRNSPADTVQGIAVQKPTARGENTNTFLVQENGRDLIIVNPSNEGVRQITFVPIQEGEQREFQLSFSVSKRRYSPSSNGNFQLLYLPSELDSSLTMSEQDEKLFLAGDWHTLGPCADFEEGFSSIRNIPLNYRTSISVPRVSASTAK